MDDLIALLACPRCDNALEACTVGMHCAGCRVDFPRLDGIPWLFAEPGAALGEWRGRWGFALARLDRSLEELDRALGDINLRAPTRERLSSLRVATADHKARLQAVLAPLAVGELDARHETHLALRTRLPADQGLTTYYANVHRDWAWGDQENEAAFEIVSSALAPLAPTRVLVLGAGAARLAYDLHTRAAPEITVALDFNPLLSFLAQRICRGERIEAYEFPIAARSVSEQAVLRTLAAPASARAGLCFVLADAHRPPFRRAAFDAVITPWLVDILPERFDSLCARINALLAPGGRWVNFGSLAFHDPDAALRYGVEECAAAMQDNGFEPVEIHEHEIPYMCSPASRHARRERIVAWAAHKHGAAKKIARYEALPDWLVRGNEPVPVSESFRTQATSARVHAFIMSLIDGRRSIKDIAALMSEQRLLSGEEAEDAIRSFLIKMYDDSQRGTTY